MAIKQEIKSASGMNTGLRQQSVYTPNRAKMTKEELRKKIERDRARDAELVTGIFRFLETKGGTLEFSYHIYPDEPNEVYSLRDEERYTLPRGVARHLNNSCFYKEYKQLNGPVGGPDIRMGSNADGRLRNNDMMASKKVHRTAFMALDFNDEDLDILPSPDLIEVSRI